MDPVWQTLCPITDQIHRSSAQVPQSLTTTTTAVIRFSEQSIAPAYLILYRNSAAGCSGGCQKWADYDLGMPIPAIQNIATSNHLAFLCSYL